MIKGLDQDSNFEDISAGSISGLILKLNRRISLRVLKTYPSNPEDDESKGLPCQIETEKLKLGLAHELKKAYSLKKTSTDVIQCLRDYDEYMPRESGMGAGSLDADFSMPISMKLRFL